MCLSTDSALYAKCVCIDVYKWTHVYTCKYREVGHGMADVIPAGHKTSEALAWLLLQYHAARPPEQRLSKASSIVQNI